MARKALCAGIGFIAALCCFAPASAEVRYYTYNARGELVASSVTGGPADGVQTTITTDQAGNRVTYETKNSKAPPRYSLPITVPINGLTTITIPE